jgi:hypothetical protein
LQIVKLQIRPETRRSTNVRRTFGALIFAPCFPKPIITNPNTSPLSKNVVEKDEVWGLEGEEGLALSSSSENDEQDVIPFWSDEALAQSVVSDDWGAFKPSSMTLVEFLENWLSGMHNDELLAGTDWDATLQGKEVEPLVLALDLANEVVATAKRWSSRTIKT